jgi:transposase
MIAPDKRKAIFLLHQEGMGVRQIARRLRVSRNTVRAIIDEQGALPAAFRKDKIQIDQELLERLLGECEGYVQRVHEKLVEEQKVDVKYSTLTRMIRDLGLGRNQKARCDRVPDEPGAEMQHDTSPYTIMVGDRRVGVVASLIYLRYSKLRYLKFYRRFNRFSMKCFFHEALSYWQYAAAVCIIDNTNLARLRGTGRNAVIVPEMAAFSAQYGFDFRCHEVGHANRKAGDERGFWTVETNFFPGRNFSSFEDLNEQAMHWATVRLLNRPVAKTGLIPAKAFEFERAFLTQLPAHLPAPYLVHERVTDQYGFAAFDGNFFWVPGTDRADVSVLEYSDRLQIYLRRELLIEYELPEEGVKNERISPKGQPKPRYHPNNRKQPTAEEEKRLRTMDEAVAAWLDFALEPKGIARHRVIRELYRLSQRMRAPLFIRAVARATKYRIRSVETILRIARMILSEGDGPLPAADVDESFSQRPAYLDGHLTDAPSFADFDGLLDDQEEDEGEDEHAESDHG